MSKQTLSAQEEATILAALRLLQEELANNPDRVRAMNHFADEPFPDDAAIDALCEKINLGALKEDGNVFVLVQEGGSSAERYVHAWDTEEEAEQDRIACAREGAYRTSPAMAVPASLAEHPAFYETVESLLALGQETELVEVPEEVDGPGL